jgi:hypothetical protein
MIEYITRPGGHDPTYQGPYNSKGVSQRLYILPAQHAALAATVHRYLNAVSTHAKYIPLGNQIVACFAAMGEVRGADPSLGWMREIDIAFFIPALRFHGLLPTGVVFFAPYLFVDIPQALATGREVHGYRKDFGTSFSDVDTAADAWVPKAADLTHVDAFAVAAPGERLRPHRLIDVTLPPAPDAPIAWPSQDEAVAELVEALTGGDVAHLLGSVSALLGLSAATLQATLKQTLVTLFHALVQGIEVSVPIVFLRQIRCPHPSAQADLQQVLEAPTRLPLATLSAHKLPGAYALTFHDQASHPFSLELGVPNGAPVAASLAIEVACDFTLEEAQ